MGVLDVALIGIGGVLCTGVFCTGVFCTVVMRGIGHSNHGEGIRHSSRRALRGEVIRHSTHKEEDN
jgi:hypothetical protein